MPSSEDGAQRAKATAYLPAAAIALVVLVFGSLAAYVPPDTGEMAVVFAPGTSQAAALAAITAAGGRWVSGSRFGNIVIAYAMDAGFKGRVARYGGLFTIAASGLCAPAPASRRI